MAPRQVRVTSLRRAALVAMIALVAGVAGAVGGFAFHWYVIEPSDEEIIATTLGLAPAGFVVDWGPTVSGAWAPALERGYARMGASSDTDVAVETVVDDLVAKGWTPLGIERGEGIDIADAGKDRLGVSVRRTTGQDSALGQVAENDTKTVLVYTVGRKSNSRTLAPTVVLGTMLTIAASVVLTLRLTRRRA